MNQTIRLNKYLQECGLCSRRAADELIREGRVTIDGRAAQLGEKITAGETDVRVDKEPVSACSERVVLAVYKPVGIVCTEDKRERDNIIDFLHYPGRVTYAGRLDKNSEGLLIMTNDGDLIERMTRGRNAHEKEYEVTVDRDLRAADLEQMAGGVPIRVQERRVRKDGEGVQTRSDKTVTTGPCQIRQTGARTFDIVLTQGLNRQIRKMCAHFGYEVAALKRVRVMSVTLGDLAPGEWRALSAEELAELDG